MQFTLYRIYIKPIEKTFIPKQTCFNDIIKSDYFTLKCKFKTNKRINKDVNLVDNVEK